MRPRNPTVLALTDIMDERFHQIRERGHTPQHDLEAYPHGCLARAAAARLIVAASQALPPEEVGLATEMRRMASLMDPWSSMPAYLRTPARRLLIEAGALTAAEIERRHLADPPA